MVIGRKHLHHGVFLHCLYSCKIDLGREDEYSWDQFECYCKHHLVLASTSCIDRRCLGNVGRSLRLDSGDLWNKK